MALSRSLFGTARTFPQTPEVDWGAQMTAWVDDVNYAIDSLMMLVGTQGVLALTPKTEALAAGATLSPANPWHRVSGSGGAVTLDGTTAISDGAKDGQLIIVMGTDNTNTVTIPDGANTELAGPVTLAAGESIGLIWDATTSAWTETRRSH